MRRIAPLAAVAAILAAASPASANYRVGLSEQSAVMFSQPAWQSLKLKRVRYIVALPFALIAAYTVTLIVMWTVLRLIWGPTHCESTGFF